MIFLARSYPEVISAKEIAKKEKIPLPYLGKILSLLEKGGLVIPKKGVEGGYCLARAPKKIKLLSIVKVLEHPFIVLPCRKEKSNCQNKRRKCLARNFWQKVEKLIEEKLSSITLEDLMK